ncbi:dNTP triphosphohydrolase [Seonamhaeicola algicola]|uniref:DNTP triphosphohydrolase n=1 Tax=Seonamhaeicola algicola TaxID=1719036 RepID=A0A5C7AVK8_9FLAO|nr:dNTP triphosphohydrolase [Seonamhaeicola algicola]TXE12738.1 dNTP triphosphohydrolase [Seonamhaeicola algicola]
MNWEQLLSLKRFGDTYKRLRKEQDQTRVGFEVDYDRIIFSQEFRSLQDKTQVIPLSQTDFVHTRLTHSLEVSVVGRSLGRKVGQKILEKYPYLKEVHGYTINDFGAIVAAAALAHDIGNPPFGHSGEKAIGEFFKTGKGQHYKAHLTSQEYQDLCDFEGNANGFKIITQNNLRLSYATLGAFMKYPKTSLPKKPTNHIADKKYGFFQSETALFQSVADDLGLLKRSNTNMSYARHPLAFLVEAADDICYTIIDFEDGINLGLIEEEFALEYMSKIIRNNIKPENYYKLSSKQERIGYLRALAIGTLIDEAANIFMQYEDAILNGTFDCALLDKSKYEAQINDIIKISIDKIYQSEEVINKEIAGYQIINKLLGVYTKAVNNNFDGNASNYDKLILKGLPKTIDFTNESLYNRLLAVCHYVSLLSDSKAILNFKTIEGVTF